MRGPTGGVHMGLDSRGGLFHDVMDVGRWNLEAQKYMLVEVCYGGWPIVLLF